jgi:SAM-dependent methyltransferase
MRYGALAENPIERVVLTAGLLPTPLLDTYAAASGRAVMVATKLGLFEALAPGALAADEVARRCGTNPRATEKLLNLLVGMRYVRFAPREGRYRLAVIARKWLLADSPRSIRDNILMKFLEWQWFEGFEDFVRSGRPLDVHAAMSDDDWGLYQRGMRAQATFAVPEVARRTPVPKGARDMLDIGGSHGYFSVALCRRHPGLRATVLDLPAAVAHAAPLLAREGLGERVGHRAGDALTDDLGVEAYDLVFIFSLVHHFDDATNRELVRRAARALRPGGVLAIGESIRPRSPRRAGQAGTFFDFYFALTSAAGTWTFEEMAAWQRGAGLRPRRPIRLLTVPGAGLQVATKPAA